MNSDFVWRGMTVADLPGVLPVAEEAHPDYPEDTEVFLEKLRLFADGCLVLEHTGSAGPHAPAGEICGYLLSHPWSAERPPALNALIGALPNPPALYYVHDLALARSARGSGAALAALDRIMAVANAQALPTIALVAVNGAEGFWRRCGFAPTTDADLARAAAAYDPDALYMTRPAHPG